jgi:polyhydroxyalkanoate synthesis regulator phasin
MQVCGDGHEEIVCETRYCPLCEKKKEVDRLEREIESLREEIDQLQEYSVEGND